MARTLIAPAGESGSSSYGFVRIRKSDGAWWNTSGTPAFEAFNGSNIANYFIAATEFGTTGVYSVTDPANTTEGWSAFVKKAGASLAQSDLVSGMYFTELEGEAPAASVTGNVGGNVAGSVASVTNAVTVGTLNSGVITTSSIADGAVTAAKLADNAITAAKLAADVATEIQSGLPASVADAVWDEAQSGHTTSGTFGYYLDSRVSQAGGGSSLTAAEVWSNPERTLTTPTSYSVPTHQFANRTLIRGVTYGGDYGHPFPVSKQTGQTWPTDLNAWTWTAKFDKYADDSHISGSSTFTATVSVTTATGDGRALALAIDATTMLAVGVCRYTYSVFGTKTGTGEKFVVESGLAKVIDNPSAD